MVDENYEFVIFIFSKKFKKIKIKNSYFRFYQKNVGISRYLVGIMGYYAEHLYAAFVTVYMYLRKQQVFKRQNCVFLTIPYSKHVTKVLQLLKILQSSWF